ncbi:hypothetical protein THF5H11_20413 [Vibrio jasicida]|nr:hypothetical protein THF5H11_20413 [Vibrio jasicida]CAH1606575.1 hypothetical protein THF5G08_30027 [Vibrio jasicida]
MLQPKWLNLQQPSDINETVQHVSVEKEFISIFTSKRLPRNTSYCM